MAHEAKTDTTEPVEELPDSWWYRVYVGVIITLVLTLIALWSFSRYFSS